jgi:hypothetical protein
MPKTKIEKWTKVLKDFRQKLLPEFAATGFILLMFIYGGYLIITSKFGDLNNTNGILFLVVSIVQILTRRGTF